MLLPLIGAGETGDPFPACTNCSGIIPKGVKVVTGRRAAE